VHTNGQGVLAHAGASWAGYYFSRAVWSLGTIQGFGDFLQNLRRNGLFFPDASLVFALPYGAPCQPGIPGARMPSSAPPDVRKPDA
jgi:hypothetical protein